MYLVNKLYQDKVSDMPADWVTVMQQLRKYAISAACNHILVMDERVGIFCEFDVPGDDDEYIDYLLSVPPDLLGVENCLIAPQGFTLFNLWRLFVIVLSDPCLSCAAPQPPF